MCSLCLEFLVPTWVRALLATPGGPSIGRFPLPIWLLNQNTEVTRQFRGSPGAERYRGGQQQHGGTVSYFSEARLALAATATSLRIGIIAGQGLRVKMLQT